MFVFVSGEEERSMGIFQQPGPRYTRLRDFGAFRATVVLYPPEGRTPQVQENASQPPGSPLSMVFPGKAWIMFALRTAVAILLLVWLVGSLPWSVLQASLTRVRYDILMIALVVGTGGIIISAYQWRHLLRTERIQRDLADLIQLYTVGITFNHFLPTGLGGDALKAWYVGGEAKNRTGAVSAGILCRITGFCGMLCVALPVALIWHQFLARELVISFILLCLLPGILLGGMLLAAILVPDVLKARWEHHRLLTPLLRVGEALSASLAQPRSLIIAVGYGALFWIVAVLNCYSYTQALDIEVPLYFLGIAIPFIALLSALPLSINGWGIREYAFVFVFATIQVPTASALLLSLFLNVQYLIFAIIGGFMYLKMGRPLQKTLVCRSSEKR
jgi:uncharacterized protein (TIRG00374 family)